MKQRIYSSQVERLRAPYNLNCNSNRSYRQLACLPLHLLKRLGKFSNKLIHSFSYSKRFYSQNGEFIETQRQNETLLYKIFQVTLLIVFLLLYIFHVQRNNDKLLRAVERVQFSIYQLPRVVERVKFYIYRLPFIVERMQLDIYQLTRVVERVKRGIGQLTWVGVRVQLFGEHLLLNILLLLRDFYLVNTILARGENPINQTFMPYSNFKRPRAILPEIV